MAIRFIQTGKDEGYYRSSIDGNTFSSRSAAEAHENSLNSSSSGSSSSATQSQSLTTTEAQQQTLDDGQGQNQTADTQQESQFNIDEAITGRRLTREEALEDIRSRSAYQSSTLASLESARERGDARLIATYERQLEATIQMMIERRVVIENNITGETTTSYIKPVSDGEKFIYSVERAVEGARASQGAETYLKYETDRILGESDAAQTPEQRAALLALATKAKQFGGSTVNMKMITDILEKAVSEGGRNNAFNLAGSLRPAVSVSKNGQVYTAYGKELNIKWEQRKGWWRTVIYSPEGVGLTELRLKDPTQALIEFGLDKNKLIEAYQYGKSQGYLTQGSNSENLLKIAQQEGNQQAIDMLSHLSTGGSIPFIEALIAGDSSQGFLEKMRAASVVPRGGVMKSGNNPLKVNQYQMTILGDEAGILAGFGVSPFSSQEEIEKEKLGYLQVYGLYQAVYDNDTDYRPSWTQDSYLQTLNQAFGTPNNNITFGNRGNLQYNFADGGAVNWGSQLGNLDSLTASIGIQNLSLRQGAAFKAANNFTSQDEYDAWRQTQNVRAGYFENLPEKTSIDTQMGQVMAPKVAAPTDSPTSTPTTTGTSTDTPTYVGATTTETGTPVAEAPTTTTPTTQQPTTMPTYGTAPISGTFGTPLQTAGLSAVPTYSAQQTSPPAQQAGFAAQQLAQTMPGTGTSNVGVQTVQYTNQYGQSMPVTETNGQPITYVPPGYTKASGAAQGGLMRNGYTGGGTVRGYASGGDVALIKLAQMNGMQGDDIDTARAFMNASEGLRNKVKAMGALMNRGGVTKKPGTIYASDGTFIADQAQRTQNLITQTMQPTQSSLSLIQPVAEDFIPTTAGMATTAAPMAQAATLGTVQQAGMPMMPQGSVYGGGTVGGIQPPDMNDPAIRERIARDGYPAPMSEPLPAQQPGQAAATVRATTATPAVQQETARLQAAQGQVSPQAQITAAQQQQTSVSGMEAAQGQAYMMDNPVQREIQAGELISGVADAEKAALFNEQIQAATATPSKQATVQGQLEGLMTQFEGGETPAWAAGSMRNAMATLSARGLGASSMAGQAVIQATMEAALPIAQMDAQTTAQFESQNLTNRQQRAMLAAQQRATFLGMEFDQAFQARVANSARIGDVANMNFTAEQNIALENSRAANTMELNNLSNRQAMVMAEAAALSNLDMANLNNRQQAAVQNAQSFLQMDMANLSNAQQTAIFKSQQNIQSLFTDQAAENAAAQFNASSENQTNQFFANLTNQTSQFNASQQNAMDQFNVNSVNALREFNSELQQQRDLFNAQNGLLIAQSNAQWRQTISTANQAAQNESNMNFAKTINALTATNLDAYWQRERDVMSFAYASGESAADRVATILQTELEAELKAQYQDSAGKGSLFATLLKGGLNYLGLSSDIKSAVVV